MKKQALAAILAALMAASALSGCGGGGESSQSGTESSTQSSAAASSGETGTEEFAGYPIETDQTLTVWTAGTLGPDSSYTDYTESPFHTGLAEMTGINVEWQFPSAGTDNTQAFNLMLVSDDLPDIIFYQIISNAQQYIDDGVIRDLTADLPVYAPNYWQYLQENEHYDKSLKTDAGQYYGVGSFRESIWGAVYAGPVLRKDWLDEQGLDEPVTMEDWDNIIRTFNEAYGARFAFVPSRMYAGFGSAYGAFATFTPGFYIDDNDQVQYAMAQENWKNYMQQLNTWYEDGLIDPDSVTLDDDGMNTKTLNNETGTTVTAISQMSAWIQNADSAGTGAEWIGVSYPVAQEGDAIVATQMEDTVQNYVAAVTTSCSDENLPLALRWLDYGFTEEGYMYWNYGTEGVSYTMEDGVPTFTDTVLNDPAGTRYGLDKYIGTQWAGISKQAEGMVKQKNAPESVAAVDLWVENNEMTEHLMPYGVTLTTEESTEYSSLATSINTYASEMALKYLTGEESLDNFDSFVETLNGMGLERVLEIQQAAYDRFLAR